MHLSHIMRLVKTQRKLNCSTKNLWRNSRNKSVDIVVKVTWAEREVDPIWDHLFSKTNLVRITIFIYSSFSDMADKTHLINFEHFYPSWTQTPFLDSLSKENLDGVSRIYHIFHFFRMTNKYISFILKMLTFLKPSTIIWKPPSLSWDTLL